jgi:DNA-binding protein H-NS
MVENSELTPNQSQAETTAQEVAEVIAEFEQYRERLLSETIAGAQKAKLPQKPALAKIEPELAQIDAALQNLRAQQAVLTTNN